jgi:hypothetical protein
LGTGVEIGDGGREFSCGKLGADTRKAVFYTVTRLLPMAISFGLWVSLRDGTLMDPANLLLLLAIGSGVVGAAAVRRYWVIRKTSRSRRDSSLLV